MDPNLIQQLIQSLQGQTNAANKQNLTQYNNLLNTVKGTQANVNNIYGQQAGLLSNAGQTQHALLDLNTQNQLGKNDQDLVSRGLDNTSIRSTTAAGINRNAGLEGTAIDQSVNQQKLGLLGQQAQGQMQLGQMQGDAILSRQNQAPDMSQYLGLLTQLGQTAGQQQRRPAMAPGVYINGRPAGVPGGTATMFG